MNNDSRRMAIFIVFGTAAMALILSLAYCGTDQKMLFASLIYGAQDKPAEPKLAQEELVSLVKPSIVRVAQTVKVVAEIPAFKIDFTNKTAVFLSEYKPLSVKIETPVVGSGFIINPDGYILTNAHVVSDETVKNPILVSVINKVALANAATLKKEELNVWAQDKEAWHALGLKIYDEVAAKAQFTIEKKITVVNPSAQEKTASDLIKNGFPAQIVKINDQFAKDNRDIAVIKIEEKNLPTVKLADSQALSTGTKIYVFGFPVTAEVSKESFIEPTFTQGVVSAIKDSQKKDFKIIQTDAKVSSGSSGGPMIDDNGDIIGIITYETNNELQSSGDNFAFAIPAKIAEDMLKDADVDNVSGNYGTHFKAGLAFAQDRRCQKAIKEYTLAKNTNGNFLIDSYIEPYIKDCNALIAKGESIDNWWAETKEWFGKVGYLGWTIIGSGAVIFVILIFFIVLLAKKMKNKEKEIGNLEDLMLEEAAKENAERKEMEKKLVGDKPATANNIQPTALPSEPAAAQPATRPLEVAIDPRLLEYIEQSRKSGISDDAIAGELEKAGWDDNTVQIALKIK